MRQPTPSRLFQFRGKARWSSRRVGEEMDRGRQRRGAFRTPTHQRMSRGALAESDEERDLTGRKEMSRPLTVRSHALDAVAVVAGAGGRAETGLNAAIRPPMVVPTLEIHVGAIA